MPGIWPQKYAEKLSAPAISPRLILDFQTIAFNHTFRAFTMVVETRVLRFAKPLASGKASKNNKEWWL